MAGSGNGQIWKDPCCRRILKHCFSSSRTANFLSMKLNIPIAVCLSKLRQLEKCGLLVKEKKIRTSQGKWVQLYRSLVIESEEGEIRSKLKESGSLTDMEDVIS